MSRVASETSRPIVGSVSLTGSFATRRPYNGTRRRFGRRRSACGPTCPSYAASCRCRSRVRRRSSSGAPLASRSAGCSHSAAARGRAGVGQLAGDASYHSFITFDLGPLDLEHWGADGALTLFFFVAGLELKREFVVGSLRRPADAAGAGDRGPVRRRRTGSALHAGQRDRVRAGRPGGWAIPAATDIAFALAVLAVVGSHLPASLRAFLLTLAVVDDLVVIVIIAVVFTDDVHVVDLLVVALALAVLWAVLQRHAGRALAGLPADRGRGVVVHARERGARHHRRRAAGPADARTSRPGRGALPGRGASSTRWPRSRPTVAVPFFALVVGRRLALRRAVRCCATRS